MIKISSFLQRCFFKIITPHAIIKTCDNYRISLAKKQVRIGNKSHLYPDTIIENLSGNKDYIIIGDNVHIRGEICVYPESSGVKIGNNVYIGKWSVIRSADQIIIGNNVLISHNVTIIDTDSHEIDAYLRTESFISLVQNGHPKKMNVPKKKIIIKDYAWISYNVCILKGVTIGRGSIVGAGSVVTKDVADWTLVAGNPAHEIRTLENKFL